MSLSMILGLLPLVTSGIEFAERLFAGRAEKQGPSKRAYVIEQVRKALASLDGVEGVEQGQWLQVVGQLVDVLVAGGNMGAGRVKAEAQAEAQGIQQSLRQGGGLLMPGLGNAGAMPATGTLVSMKALLEALREFQLLEEPLDDGRTRWYLEPISREGNDNGR